MTLPVDLTFETAAGQAAVDTLTGAEGRIVLILPPEGQLSPPARRIDRAMRGALSRALAGKPWGKLGSGEAMELAYPGGLKATALQLVKLGRGASVPEARRAGGAIGRGLGEAGAVVLAGTYPRPAEIAFGVALRAYDFRRYCSETAPAKGPVRFLVRDDAATRAAAQPLFALAEGVVFTRDLVNEPANVLTTDDFAARLAGLEDLGLNVEVLEEDALEKLGMRALLAVGQGSESPSKVVVMKWSGGAKDDPPLALVGKGVVFDTGGISIKPAAGMEEMTMDMGGAGVVAGVMRTLALRKAEANVVGLVGLVENMPDGRAQRPGDIVKSMKGDTIEVVNTDAEGRMVLADVLWYAQDRFKPCGIIDLATLTGAIIVALGQSNAGVFANDDKLCGALLKAAAAEGEGAWRMPMGPDYDTLIKSRLADMKNSGGRYGGAITAAQFLRRFVKDDTPWCHIDIAGVTLATSGSALAPEGATGWGVATLNRLVAEMLEK